MQRVSPSWCKKWELQGCSGSSPKSICGSANLWAPCLGGESTPARSYFPLLRNQESSEENSSISGSGGMERWTRSGRGREIFPLEALVLPCCSHEGRPQLALLGITSPLLPSLCKQHLFLSFLPIPNPYMVRTDLPISVIFSLLHHAPSPADVMVTMTLLPLAHRENKEFAGGGESHFTLLVPGLPSCMELLGLCSASPKSFRLALLTLDI